MKRRRLYFPALTIVLVLIIVVFFTDLLGVDVIPGLPKIRLQRTTTFNTSSVTLQDVRELYALTTIEYVHRYVFPYDFLPETVTIQDVNRKLRSVHGSPEEILDDEELLYYRTWNLATDIGLARGDGFDFVVVTIELTAGFDVSGLSDEENRTVTSEQFTDAAGEARKRAVVTLPEAQVLTVSVEDIVPGDYPYPDLSLGAADWRRVTDYVRDRPLDEETERQILDTAENNAQQFLYRLLRSAGYDDVVFELR